MPKDLGCLGLRKTHHEKIALLLVYLGGLLRTTPPYGNAFS